MSDINIRPATEGDCRLILQFIIELAVYEKLEDEVVATENDIRDSLFGENTVARAVICEIEGEPVGFAFYFYNHSTWLGKKGLYLEDLYVTPAARGKGAGQRLLSHLARIAVENDCGRFEWSVLDWNELAINFYKNLGARPMDGWIGYRLTGKALRDLADS